jgi:hypothetical protein
MRDAVYIYQMNHASSLYTRSTIAFLRRISLTFPTLVVYVGYLQVVPSPKCWAAFFFKGKRKTIPSGLTRPGPSSRAYVIEAHVLTLEHCTIGQICTNSKVASVVCIILCSSLKTGMAPNFLITKKRWSAVTLAVTRSHSSSHQLHVSSIPDDENPKRKLPMKALTLRSQS